MTSHACKDFLFGRDWILLVAYSALRLIKHLFNFFGSTLCPIFQRIDLCGPDYFCHSIQPLSKYVRFLLRFKIHHVRADES